MVTVALILFALKIAGVGSFSWLIPIGLLLLNGIINTIIEKSDTKKIGSDWHKGMFD